MRMIDEVGNVYSRLTVVEFSHMDHGRAHWLVQRSCGSPAHSCSGRSLRNRTTRSCGCLRCEQAAITGHNRKGHKQAQTGGKKMSRRKKKVKPEPQKFVPEVATAVARAMVRAGMVEPKEEPKKADQ
jgi:hypothetical protein